MFCYLAFIVGHLINLRLKIGCESYIILYLYLANSPHTCNIHVLRCAMAIPIPKSILSCISKIFEKLLILQLRMYFDDIFSQYLSVYRTSYGCQDVLLHFINICKKALDDGNVCMALLTDLSKAFDCLPYRLLICKLRAYGLSVNACELLKSYFCERKQRVKLGDKYRDWLSLSKGVPQGSLMGSFIFNIFSSDLLLLLEKKI